MLCVQVRVEPFMARQRSRWRRLFAYLYSLPLSDNTRFVFVTDSNHSSRPASQPFPVTFPMQSAILFSI
nr:hypothetical protein [Cronobacter turicensis]